MTVGFLRAEEEVGSLPASQRGQPALERSFIILSDLSYSFSLSLSLYFEKNHNFLTFQNNGSFSGFMVMTISKILLVSLLKTCLFKIMFPTPGIILEIPCSILFSESGHLFVSYSAVGYYYVLIAILIDSSCLEVFPPTLSTGTCVVHENVGVSLMRSF